MKRKLLIALLCAAALCWLCAGALAVNDDDILIYDSTEIELSEDQVITVQIYPNDSGCYVTAVSINLKTWRFYYTASNNYVFAGYRVRDLNDPISVGTSDPYAQFGTAVENINRMPDMEHPVFTAIFERVNVAVFPAGAGSAYYDPDAKAMKAEPNVDYRFLGWKYATDEGAAPVDYTSTNATWSMANPSTTGTYKAYFEKVNVAVSPAGAGSAYYDPYAKAMKAEPNVGYRFLGWKYAADENEPVDYTSTNATWSMANPSTTGTYKAYFEKMAMAEYALSPAAFTLTKSGYTDIPVELTWLVLGKVWDSDTEEYYLTEGISFHLHGGTLADAAGHTIPFQVADENHTAHGNGAFLYTWHTSQGETDIMPVWIDDNDFEQAEPGTYTGTLNYDVQWKCMIDEHELAFPYGSGQIALTLVVPEHGYAITTDGAVRVYYYNDSFEQVFPTAALEGTALSLTLDDSAVPETGYYFTGEFTLNGVSLGREYSEDNENYSWPVTEFTMSDEDVTICAVQAERETLTLSFAPGDTRALPMDAWMQLQYYETAEGEPPLIWYDEATGTEALDVNRDGLPDLQIAFDDEAYCVNLTKLPDCAAFGAFAFTFSGPTDRCGTITFTIPAPAFGTPDFALPSFLTTVEAEAFEGIAAGVVDVPASCTSIGNYAFRSCPNLTQIRIPASCALGTDVFGGCAMVYVFGTAGSPAESYCNTHANCEFVPLE